jgi:kynureninase
MDRAEAEALDRDDPLRRSRDLFELPKGVIYLDGNSLGPIPRAVYPAMEDLLLRQWGQDLITSWNKAGWIEAPQRVGGKIARLIGAKGSEVVVADSTSVNLYKLAAGALSLRPGRTKIVTEAGNFHTDVYVLEGLARLAGAELVVLPRGEVLAAIDDATALVMLTHVHYATAEVWDMAAVTAASHDKGAVMLWDLSHTAGAVGCDLNAARADLAVGCGYKHLNGGPGAPAFLYVAERHQGEIATPLSGWMGHAEPFAFEPRYRPAPDIRAQLCGTPPILGIAALECGVDTHLATAPATVAAKGRSLCGLFIRLVEERCAGHGLTLVGPRDLAQRGLHVSFAHPDGYALVQALIARGVVGDFRDPDICRFGFTPLYLSHAEVWDAVEVLRDVLESRAFEKPEFRTRAAVT